MDFYQKSAQRADNKPKDNSRKKFLLNKAERGPFCRSDNLKKPNAAREKVQNGNRSMLPLYLLVTLTTLILTFEA